MSDPVLAHWTTLLRGYDDDAWTALANRGLLRRARKDVGTVPVAVEHLAPDALELSVGELRVTFPVSGPAQARCTCASPVICQHVVAAGLWLAGQTDAEPTLPHRPDPQQVLSALTAEDLRAHAGAAGLRWARQFLQDLDDPPQVTVEGYPVVTFRRPDLVARFPGGGLDGVLLNPTPRSPQRYQVAAVLAWQQAHGAATPEPDEPDPTASDAEVVLTGRAAARAELRARLLPRVHALLVDLARVGVSHLSPAVHERLTTAAVSAQGAELHRLARTLRRLADEVDLLLGRSARADDLALLDLAAVALALVTTLSQGPTAGPEAGRAARRTDVDLVGEARTTYHPQDRLDLVGLGGVPWRSGTGYQGLTCVFWAPAQQRYLTWTDARPTLLDSFDPRTRWSQPAPWSGLATPAAGAGRRLTLRHARISRTDRLSGVESTTARVRAADGEEVVTQLQVLADFSSLPERLGLLDRSPLDPPDRGRPWAVLAPAGFHTATFDPVTQVLSLRVSDAAGAALRLEVPWSDLTAHLIGRLETLDPPASGTLLVARVSRRRGELVAEPVSLVHPSRAVRVVDSLHFDPGPESALVEQLRRAGAPEHRPTDPTAPGDPDPRDLPRALVELRGFLEQQGQRGCAGAEPDDVRRELAARHGALRVSGWPVFTDPDPRLDPAEALLRSLYLVQQCELLLG